MRRVKIISWFPESSPENLRRRELLQRWCTIVIDETLHDDDRDRLLKRRHGTFGVWLAIERKTKTMLRWARQRAARHA